MSHDKGRHETTDQQRRITEAGGAGGRFDALGAAGDASTTTASTSSGLKSSGLKSSGLKSSGLKRSKVESSPLTSSYASRGSPTAAARGTSVPVGQATHMESTNPHPPTPTLTLTARHSRSPLALIPHPSPLTLRPSPSPFTLHPSPSTAPTLALTHTHTLTHIPIHTLTRTRTLTLTQAIRTENTWRSYDLIAAGGTQATSVAEPETKLEANGRGHHKKHGSSTGNGNGGGGGGNGGSNGRRKKGSK